MSVYDEADEYCPHCDNHYVSNFIFRILPSFAEMASLAAPTRLDLRANQVIEAKTPQAMLVAEGEDARVDSR
jgi:hypothetical protein